MNFFCCASIDWSATGSVLGAIGTWAGVIAATVVAIMLYKQNATLARKQEELEKEQRELELQHKNLEKTEEVKRLKLQQDIESKSRVGRLYEMFFGDKEISDAFYLVEYGKFIYADNLCPQVERKIDKMLYCLNYICDCIENSLIDKSDATLFHYRIKRIVDDENIKKYFERLNVVYERRNMKHPHPYLQKYNDN